MLDWLSELKSGCVCRRVCETLKAASFSHKHFHSDSAAEMSRVWPKYDSIAMCLQAYSLQDHNDLCQLVCVWIGLL